MSVEEETLEHTEIDTRMEHFSRHSSGNVAKKWHTRWKNGLGDQWERVFIYRPESEKHESCRWKDNWKRKKEWSVGLAISFSFEWKGMADGKGKRFLNFEHSARHAELSFGRISKEAYYYRMWEGRSSGHEMKTQSLFSPTPAALFLQESDRDSCQGSGNLSRERESSWNMHGSGGRVIRTDCWPKTLWFLGFSRVLLFQKNAVTRAFLAFWFIATRDLVSFRFQRHRLKFSGKREFRNGKKWVSLSEVRLVRALQEILISKVNETRSGALTHSALLSNFPVFEMIRFTWESES